MTQFNGNDTNTNHAALYETPAFTPGMAFAWTLRSAEISAEIARLHSERAARYETPTFDPGVAFSWTLRSEEIARRLQRRSMLAVAA